MKKLPMPVTLDPLWFRGDRFASHFFNALSCSFPLGEKAFVNSVVPYVPQIKSDVLLRQVKIFLQQEENHSAAHREFNDALVAQGYPVERMERYLAKFIALGNNAPPIENLAVTVCFEHFTAILSQVVLSNPALFEGIAPEVTRLWRWHCQEEIAHRSVAFDVYQEMGGTKGRLIGTMIFVTTLFAIEIVGMFAMLLKHDGLLWGPSVWLRGFSFLWGKPGILRKMLPDYFSFFLPNFHPRQLAR